MDIEKGIKKAAKKIVGEDGTQYIKGIFYIAKHRGYLNSENCMEIHTEYVEDVQVLELEKKHVFGGYYDVPLFSETDHRILVHVIRQHAVTGKDAAEIGFFDYQENRFEKITETLAWNWQQGSRLRWSLEDPSCIYVNKFDCGKYYCSKIDICSKEEKRRIPQALYDISRDEKIGITCDFVRLQKYRPGYGYSNITDPSEKVNVPSDSGVSAVDMNSGEERLLISLEKLAKSNDPEGKYIHYINHISISPSGEKVMFFHIFTYPKSANIYWKTQLCVIDVEGNNFHILENDANVSHYTWISDFRILITGITRPDNTYFYRVYDVENGDYEEISDSLLCQDGHPSMLGKEGWMVTDTYPDKSKFQHVIQYDMKNKIGMEIASLFSDPRMSGERRCDLHPKVSPSCKRIALDSTYTDKRRKVVILKLKGSR